MKFFASMLLVFTALTAVMTYPQVLHLHDGVHDDGDPLLNTWTLTWVAHQLPRAPARLFDANIFYPERKTLAFTETLLLPGMLAAPLHWIGVAPLLVHNLVLLSGFAVSGAGTALLVRSLTGNTAAAILAGIVFAFLPYRIDHMPHLQLQQTQCLPLALWAFHRLLERGRVSDGVWFGSLHRRTDPVVHLLRPVPRAVSRGGLRRHADRRTQDAEAAAHRAGGGRPCRADGRAPACSRVPGRAAGRRRARPRRSHGVQRARMRNYLAPPEPNLLYGDVFHRFTDNERRLFPGSSQSPSRSPLFGHENTKTRNHQFPNSPSHPILAYGLGALIAFDISLGFNGFTYRVLYDYLLPFRGLRVPARMGLMVGFSLAVLAGYGVARLTEMIRSPSARRSLAVVLGLLMLLEYASKPLIMQIVPTGPSEAYADLLKDVGDSPTATIFEFPASSADDPTYMYYSTFHWQNLVNGYGGFFPPWYGPLMESMERFPDGAPIAAVKAHGARYLLVHGERLIGDRYRRLIYQLDMRPGLTLVSRRAAEREGQHGEISTFRVQAPVVLRQSVIRRPL